MPSLRSFVLIADGATFSQAAELVGRSQSAISLQIQKLEREAGTCLLARDDRQRHNGRARLTAAGERFATFSRGFVALNDEAVAAMRGPARRGLRLGIAYDVASSVLAAAIPVFAKAHPDMELTFRIAATSRLFAAVDQGELDVAIGVTREGMASQLALADVPMIWLGVADLDVDVDALLPLAVCDQDCLFRQAAIDILRDRHAFRIVVTSSLLEGILIPTGAGLCVTLRTPYALRSPLIDVSAKLALPRLPNIRIVAHSRRGKRIPELDVLLESCASALKDAADRWSGDGEV